MGSSSGLFQSTRERTCGVRRIAIGANLIAATYVRSALVSTSRPPEWLPHTASSMKLSLVRIFCSCSLLVGPILSGKAWLRNWKSLCLSETVFFSYKKELVIQNKSIGARQHTCHR